MKYTEITAVRDSDGNILLNPDGSHQMVVVTQEEIQLSIPDIDAGWKTFYRDYKQARKALKSLMAAKGGVDALSEDEKRVVARWHIIPTLLIDQILNFPASRDKLDASKEFNLQSIASRDARYEHVFSYVWGMFDYPDLKVIDEAMQAHQFRYRYVTRGQEGKGILNHDGVPDESGLYDWIMSTNDSAGAGFSELVNGYGQPVQPKYGTMADVKAYIMDVFENGNY